MQEQIGGGKLIFDTFPHECVMILTVNSEHDNFLHTTKIKRHRVPHTVATVVIVHYLSVHALQAKARPEPCLP